MSYRKKQNKYGSRKAVSSGIVFDSTNEAKRYDELRLLEKTGRIVDLVCQPEFVIQPSFKIGSRTIRAIKYKADFSYREHDNPSHQIVEDVKSVFTAKLPVYRLKIKMLLFRNLDMDFREVMWDKLQGDFISKEFK